MGAKESKEQILTYDEAVKRITKNELVRLQSAYKRCCGFSGSMRESTFLRDVLGERIPTKLAQRVFDVMSSGSKGMTCKDLITVLVLLTRGRENERLKLICAVYSDVNGLYISRKSMSLMVRACENSSLPDEAVTLFYQNEHVPYDVFQRWINEHSNILSVTRWLLRSGGVTFSLTDNSEMPNFYQTLAGVTHLEETDIIQLEKHYWSLQKQSKTGLFDLKTFEGIVCPPLPQAIGKGLFNAFDVNNDNHIDFKEISCGVSACCRGPTAERQKFCFKIFDEDRDGKLNQEELKWMGHILVQIRKMCSQKAKTPLKLDLKPHTDPDHGRTVLSPQADTNDITVKIANSKFHDGASNSSTKIKTLPIESTQEQSSTTSQTIMDYDEIDEVVSSALQFATDQDGCLSLEEYQMWAMEDSLPTLLLNIVIEVCHIALGLRPLTPQDEGNIIRGWLRRTDSNDVKPGETWYVISSTWWKKWKKYTAYDPVLKSTVSKQWEHNGTEVDPTLETHERTSSSDTASSACEASEGMVHGLSSHSKHSVLSTSNSTSSSISRSSTCTNNSIAPPGHPGAINNSDIIVEENSKYPTLTDEGGRLKETVCVGTEFEVLPEPVWKALHHWYTGQPILPRIVLRPVGNELPAIEFQRLHVTIYKHQMPQYPQQSPNATYFTGNNLLSGFGNSTMSLVSKSYSHYFRSGGSPRRILCNRATFSARHTIQQVQTFLSSRLCIPFDNMRLWNYIDENNAILMEEESATLEAFGVKQGSKILVEVRNVDLSWPEELCQLARHKKSKPKRAIALGATGLANIGNTCFMNSAVQCLSNTQPLTKYFQSAYHLYELNKTNPLGMKGHIAKRYSDLINDLWSGNCKSIAPLKLRWTISKYAPQFNGFLQHDSQELLSFLLDGLHEDLNRVHNKPYIELKDSDGRPDEEVAQEAWENHLMRNQSIIVDLFHGQIRSQVNCLECGSESITFDPFTFLSLPLPMENSTYLDVIVVKLNCTTPVCYGLRLSTEDTVWAIKTALTEMCGIKQDQLLLTSVFGANIKSILTNETKIRSTTTGSLYAYEIPPPQVVTITKKKEPNGTLIKNEKTQTKDVVESNIPSTLHESHKTSITNLNALYDDVNANGDAVAVNKESLSTKLPGKSIRVVQPETKPVKGSSFHCVPPENDTASSTTTFDTTKQTTSDCYVTALHRKTTHQEFYFISPQKCVSTLFGVPVIVPFIPGQYASTLYENVWKQVSRLVSPSPPQDSERNHATDCDESLGSRYPFVLRNIQKCGTMCGGACPWYSFCRGCTIPCANEEYLSTSGYIAIDWDATALHLRYQQSKEREVVNDKSVVRNNSGQRRPIDLAECLRAFTKEEELGKDELYYCGKCKAHQLAKKKLEIWRLPPILIIHLKRFQLVNGRWIKSHKVVDFPRNNFDPSSFMTKRDNNKIGNKIIENGDVHIPNIDVSPDMKNKRVKMNGDVITDDKKQISFADNTNIEHEPNHDKRRASGPARVRQPSFREESPPLFNLYALSCHSGIIGGGHYVSYSKNVNSKWYFYNDSSCREVSPDSMGFDGAYMLFYERQNVDYGEFMPSIVDKRPIDTSNMDDDFDSEYKKICSVQ